MVDIFPKRRGRPCASNADRLRPDLLEAAAALFLAHGFEGTSMGLVVKKARASKRTLYQHFPTKEALFEAVIEHISFEVMDIQGKIAGDAARERLENLALQLINRALTPEILSVLRVISSAVPKFPELTVSTDKRIHHEVMNLICAVLQEERTITDAQGVFSIFELAEHFFSITAQTFIFRALMGADVSVLRDQAPAAVHRAVDIFMNGLIK